MKLSDDIYFVEYDLRKKNMICHFKNSNKTKTVRCTIEEYINFDKQLYHEYAEK